MPCAAGELCLWQESTPKEPDGYTCCGGCGGWLHGNCGDVDQEGNTLPPHMYAELATSFGKGVRHGSKNAEVDILAEALNTLSVRVHHAQKTGSTPDLYLAQVLENLRVTTGDCVNTAAVKRANDWATIEDQEDVAEAVSLDGVEEMTEYLNETCDKEVEKTCLTMKKRRTKMIRGEARCHRLMQNFRPTSVPWRASRRSVA